jgi:hypothetical protein
MTGRVIIFLAILSFASPAIAEESAVDNSPDLRATAVPDDTRPIYSTDTRWAASLLAGIAGLFLAAVVIGPIVRAEAPEAVPAAMSHEEDPAADRH